MSTEALLGLVLSAVGLIASLLAVAYRVGGLAGKITAQGETLDKHRAESALANGALRGELAAVRDDVGDIRERVAGLEATARFKVVRS